MQPAPSTSVCRPGPEQAGSSPPTSSRSLDLGLTNRQHPELVEDLLALCQEILARRFVDTPKSRQCVKAERHVEGHVARLGSFKALLEVGDGFRPVTELRGGHTAHPEKQGTESAGFR